MYRKTELLGEIILSLGIIGIALAVCLFVCGGSTGGSIEQAVGLFVGIIALSAVGVLMVLIGIFLIYAVSKARRTQMSSQPPDEPGEE
jgi:hypothetical protein